MRKMLSGMILVGLALFLVGCRGSQSESSHPLDGLELATLSGSSGAPAPVAMATAEPLSVSTFTSLPYSDDFSDPASGWQISQDEYGKAAYSNSAYLIEAYQNGYVMWGVAGQNFQDVKIDVDALVTTAASNPNNGFGVDCRVQPNGDGYSFHISSDGYYALLKYQDTNADPLVDWTPSTDIPTDGKSVYLTVICQGSRLSLAVNGVPVASASDATYSSGDLSLSAVSFTDNLPTDVQFTNLRVTDPNLQ